MLVALSIRLSKEDISAADKAGGTTTTGIRRSIRAWALLRKWSAEDPNLTVAAAIERVHLEFGSEGEEAAQ
jgi:hypothetical protein